jgi:hypothetical protein
MRPRVCYISRNYYNLSGAGNKAKTDIEKTLQQTGAVNIGLPTTFYDNKVVAFFLNLVGIIKACFCVRGGDVLVLQYPVKKYFGFLCQMAHARGAKVVVVIHDLMSLHRKRVTLSTEISRLSKGDYVIASNAQMKEWLAAQGLKCQMGALGLFDYRSDALAPRTSHLASRIPEQSSPTRSLSSNYPLSSLLSPLSSPDSPRWSLVYAGALTMRKNAYLLELARQAQHFRIHIYGNKEGLPGIEEAPHAVCHPFMPADEFIRSAEGDFGLVWDGNSLETCQGDFGEYLRYNSPHKVSFYLRAGLPVVIWKEAAVASIIEQEGIGITIGSIAELEQRLQTMSISEYEQMRKNVVRVSGRLASGQYFLEALEQALQMVKA